MRPKSLKKRVVAWVLPVAVKGIIHVLWKTCRIKHVTGENHIQGLLQNGDAFIPCYWHQSQIFCVRYLLGLREKGLNLGYLISPSSDGDAATRMFGNLGVRIIRGSATRSGAAALRDIYTVIKKDNVSPIITPDGPTGPIFEVKQGVVMLAQLSGAPLVPISYSADRFWQLTSWDRFVIPKPFSSISIVVGEPVVVDKKLAVDDLPHVAEEMSRRMNAAAADARAAF